MSAINLCVTEQIGHVCSFCDDRDIKHQRHCSFFDKARLSSSCMHFRAGVMCANQDAYPTARTIHYRPDEMPEDSSDSNLYRGEGIIDTGIKDIITTDEILPWKIWKYESEPLSGVEEEEMTDRIVVSNKPLTETEPRYIMYDDPRKYYEACVRRYISSIGMKGGDHGLKMDVETAERRLMEFISTPSGSNHFYDIHREMNYPPEGVKPAIRDMEVQDGFFVMGQCVDTKATREFFKGEGDHYDYQPRNKVLRARVMREFEERANPILERLGEERKFRNVQKNSKSFGGDLISGDVFRRMCNRPGLFKS